ncbi:MAG: YdcF family protein [Deltaproteobacteria bacterium]|nr:YdcF family protein [Deltaproteobacteria bacterium]
MKLRKLMIILAISILMIVGIFNSPRFLLYSTDHKKADAVIILVGPDFKARKKEANDLINKGMADFLIIPAYNKTYGISNEGKEQYLLPALDSSGSGKNNDLSFPKFYEDTHIEIIKAQKIMSRYGLKSAIFVSSPYHMRRIKLIAGKVFKSSNHNFYFVPTRYEKAPVKIGELSSADWKKVRREYGKIIWFFIYYAWSEYIGFD